MTSSLPVACTLLPGELAARLDEIHAVGRDALRGARRDGAHAVLTFSPAAGVHERLAAIVAAEARCCAFLRMDVSASDDAILLAIDAADDAAPIVAELVGAFSAGRGSAGA